MQRKIEISEMEKALKEAQLKYATPPDGSAISSLVESSSIEAFIEGSKWARAKTIEEICAFIEGHYLPIDPHEEGMADEIRNNFLNKP